MEYKTEKYLIRFTEKLRIETEQLADSCGEQLSEYIRKAIEERNKLSKIQINKQTGDVSVPFDSNKLCGLGEEAMKKHFGIDISTRAGNALIRNGIKTLDELLKRSSYQILTLRRMGKKSYQEIVDALSQKGYQLNDY